MRYLAWDFDGTLGYREGMWSGALLEVVRREADDHTLTAEQLRPFLQTGFPWLTPEVPHLGLTTPQAWWDALDPVFERALVGAGLEPGLAATLARRVRHVYPELSRWHLFDDALPALEALSAAGWTHLLLSNHVPELPAILRHLGLTPYLARVFNSAETGYEKPHPQAFAGVLAAVGEPEAVWMIGDNLQADVQGAERAGIPAVLVRKADPAARHFCATLLELPALLPGRACSGLAL